MPHLLAWFLVYGFLLVIYIYYIDGNPRPTVVGPQWGTENEPQPLADGESIDKTIPIRIHPNLETTEPWLNETNRANAAIVIVAPSKEYINVQKTIVHLEAQFNNRFQYPYVFLSELSQDSAYKQNIRRLIGKRAHFGSLEMGQRDDNIASLVASHFLNSTDSEKEYLTEQTQLSRFKTGMLFRHRLVENLDYIWLVEPGTELICDITYDPFIYMRSKNLKYGWNMAIKKENSTLHNMIKYSQDFVETYPEYSVDETFKMKTSSKDSSFCQYGSEMQIFDVNLFQGVAYWRYFEWLDQRLDWLTTSGQAALSQAVRSFIPRNQIYFFNEMGSKGSEATHCPQPKELRKKCSCGNKEGIELQKISCAHDWY